MPSTPRQLGPTPINPPDTGHLFQESHQDQQQHQPQTAMQKLKQKPKPSGIPAHAVFGKACLRPLLSSTSPYLDPTYLEKFNVRDIPLDFYDGTSRDPQTGTPSPACLELYPYEKMKDAVDKNKPWLAWMRLRGERFQYTRDLSTYWPEDNDGWWHAKTIVDLLDRYLRNNHLSDSLSAEAASVLDETQWRDCLVHPALGLNVQNESVKWCAWYQWVWQGKSQSHVVCTLHDREPLPQDGISVPEMRTIVTMSSVKAFEEGNHHRKSIPVVLISAAGQQLRVLVGIVDSGKECIEIRRSPIIDFSQGEQPRDNYREWITTLCWIVATPVEKAD